MVQSHMSNGLEKIIDQEKFLRLWIQILVPLHNSFLCWQRGKIKLISLQFKTYPSTRLKPLLIVLVVLVRESCPFFH